MAAKQSITKTEAVRQAMSQLGKDAPRNEMQAFIKTKFGIEMTPDHISNCKSDIQKQAAKKAKSAKAKKPTATAPSAAAKKPAAPAAASANSKTSSSIGLTDIQTVKELVGKVGVGQLKGLIDVLTK